MPPKLNSKSLWVGIVMALAVAFLSFSALKIYVVDPEIYARKVELKELELCTKADIAANRVQAAENRRAVDKIELNIEFIRKDQLEMKKQFEKFGDKQQQIFIAIEKISKDR
uniref:Uncharacterized protein n=1 Tax=viral metagenome TaxID=1070528 RepID=A0A6M3KZV1_9ZZZZ